MSENSYLKALEVRAFDVIRGYCAAGYEGRWDDLMKFVAGARAERIAQHIAAGTIVGGGKGPYPPDAAPRIVSVDTDGELVIVHTLTANSVEGSEVRRKWVLIRTSDGLKLCD